MQAAPVKPAAAPKPAPVRRVADADFAGGLVGSDVEAIAFDPWKLSAERDPEVSVGHEILAKWAGSLGGACLHRNKHVYTSIHCSPRASPGTGRRS